MVGYPQNIIWIFFLTIWYHEQATISLCKPRMSCICGIKLNFCVLNSSINMFYLKAFIFNVYGSRKTQLWRTKMLYKLYSYRISPKKKKKSKAQIFFHYSSKSWLIMSFWSICLLCINPRIDSGRWRQIWNKYFLTQTVLFLSLHFLELWITSLCKNGKLFIHVYNNEDFHVHIETHICRRLYPSKAIANSNITKREIFMQ